MKFTTLIPLRFNDGKKVPPEKISRIIDELAAQFNGCSDEGITKGQWLDPKDSRLYRDESRRITVVCPNAQLREAEQAVVKIGQELDQGGGLLALHGSVSLFTMRAALEQGEPAWRPEYEPGKAA